MNTKIENQCIKTKKKERRQTQGKILPTSKKLAI